MTVSISDYILGVFLSRLGPLTNVYESLPHDYNAAKLRILIHNFNQQVLYNFFLGLRLFYVGLLISSCDISIPGQMLAT